MLLFIRLGLLDEIGFRDFLTSLDLILLDLTLSCLFRGKSRLDDYELSIFPELSGVNRKLGEHAASEHTFFIGLKTQPDHLVAEAGHDSASSSINELRRDDPENLAHLKSNLEQQGRLKLHLEVAEKMVE